VTSSRFVGTSHERWEIILKRMTKKVRFSRTSRFTNFETPMHFVIQYSVQQRCLSRSTTLCARSWSLRTAPSHLSPPPPTTSIIQLFTCIMYCYKWHHNLLCRFPFDIYLHLLFHAGIAHNLNLISPLFALSVRAIRNTQH
jgi:hypothetical protein